MCISFLNFFKHLHNVICNSTTFIKMNDFDDKKMVNGYFNINIYKTCEMLSR